MARNSDVKSNSIPIKNLTTQLSSLNKNIEELSHISGSVEVIARLLSDDETNQFDEALHNVVFTPLIREALANAVTVLAGRASFLCDSSDNHVAVLQQRLLGEAS